MKQIIILMLCVCNSVLATTHYVDLNSPTPTPPYTSWATSATNIQDAVDVAVSNDTVLVEDGRYLLSSQVVVPNAIMVVSKNGPKVTLIDGGGVTRGFLLNDSCLISGFTITNGYATSDEYGNIHGGGIYCRFSGTVISNCTFIGNSATDWGGGVCSFRRGASAVVTHCTFTDNSARNGGGLSDANANYCTFTGNSASSLGGGMSGGTASSCIFSNNSAGSYGGAMGYYVTANNCTIIGNSAGVGGGGMVFSTANNCIFTENSAGSYGGGMYGTTSANGHGTANNCTFTRNSAREGGGISDATANNCILWGNTASALGNDFYESELYYSCASGAVTNDGRRNISVDPLFLDATAGDFHLLPNSPCIDTGYNGFVSATTDAEGNPRILGLSVDMGAYEFTGDTDNDGLADEQELILGTNPINPDSDGDGLLDGEEVNNHLTDPLLVDTDNDGLSDSEEINRYGTDPLNPDSDGDGASDGDEINRDGTNPKDPNDADVDTDGMSDYWEIQYFENIGNCEPNDDPDGDGYTNLAEFRNGTIPITFDIYLARRPSVEFGWETVTGKVYQLQASTNLITGEWFDIGDPVPGNGTTHYILQSAREHPHRVYQVLSFP